MALRVTLLAALLHEREREITDTLVELLISTVHRIGARAEKKVTEQLINAFKKVSGKENILFKLAEASLGTPEGTVRQVVFLAVSGGEATLRELVHEFKTRGPAYRPRAISSSARRSGWSAPTSGATRTRTCRRTSRPGGGEPTGAAQAAGRRGVHRRTARADDHRGDPAERPDAQAVLAEHRRAEVRGDPAHDG
ncbi:hypothetical protein [Streptomyces finlayi]|uniref:hypothetical protein n=1 Tax=Streptomyces finlayi TaxID=67296 RepID=UPI001626274E|nr:hypothetical protein [Streptomyces finlayi]